MAFPKLHLFDACDQQISKYHRALGYPARIKILRILEEYDRQQVKDLAKLLPLTEGAITEHLKKLREAGLVKVDIIGLMNFYSLDRSMLLGMSEMLDKFLSEIGVIESSQMSDMKKEVLT
jgi:DNA-binding transcriptional ArsR family regulator